jgi:hypothetical protein
LPSQVVACVAKAFADCLEHARCIATTAPPDEGAIVEGR